MALDEYAFEMSPGVQIDSLSAESELSKIRNRPKSIWVIVPLFWNFWSGPDLVTT